MTTSHNKQLSQDLGWRPADFGCLGYGKDLTKAILVFQRQHFLDRTGLGDRRTYKALLGMCAFAKAIQHRDKREKGLGGLGQVLIYKPDDPRVIRTQVFLGTRLHVAGPGTFDGLPTGIHTTIQTIVAKPGTARQIRARLDGWAGNVIEAYLVDMGKPWEAGRAIATAWQASAGTGGPDGIVLVPTLAGWTAGLEIPTAAMDLQAALLGSLGKLPPIALGWGLGTLAIFRSPRSWRQAIKWWQWVDAVLYDVPWAWPRRAVEYSLGETMGGMRAFAQVPHPFVYPTYTPRAWAHPAEVYRFRDWCRRRGIRGQGIRSNVRGDLLDAFLAPLPEARMIDNVELFNGEDTW